MIKQVMIFFRNLFLDLNLLIQLMLLAFLKSESKGERNENMAGINYRGEQLVLKRPVGKLLLV